ncbi:DUF3644 domain-containing protein [Salmonella enterica]|nr:DUF3644 domain-containing protein [Salmonella enterica]ECF3544547.1 DUF3644 domain-containing protein [Salmonella enterica subsp. enterica]EHU5043373.1 DUF3644 domain-containing protein [Salmonella enterica]EHW1678987.1 DUF3644 domain-containing protein [Salmonella enterica]EIL4045594.1 DUF3644 domain-containing protein [Salmonella enterica]EIL4050065.1 DUF3644 domain-containing protein [Salmonella enterica]
MRFNKVDLAFDFLVQKEISQESFTIQELAEATGWTIPTCKTYPTKKWNTYISHDGEHYATAGFKYLSKEDFRNIHSQKNVEHVKSERSLNLKKAREFALLAVATYNNPFTEFKTHGFIVNITIAFTALFHAIYAKKGIKYCYLNDDGTPKIIDGEEKAWELKTCCDKYWPGMSPPEKLNLQFLIEIRNIIEHRGLPEIDALTFGECQAAINNFEDILEKEFGDDNSLMMNLSLAMQLTRMSQQAQIDALKKLQSKNFNIIKKFIEDFKKDLSDDIIESQQFRLRALLVPLVGKKASNSDIAIEFINISNLSQEELKKLDSGIAFIKGVENQFKLKPSKVVELVQKRQKHFNLSTCK